MSKCRPAGLINSLSTIKRSPIDTAVVSFHLSKVDESQVTDTAKRLWRNGVILLMESLQIALGAKCSFKKKSISHSTVGSMIAKDLKLMGIS